MRGQADIQARRLKLKALMPDVELMQKTLGEMNGDARFSGSGNSVAALLGNSNGNLKLLMNDGLISRNLMEIVGLNLGNYIVGQIFGDDAKSSNPVRCLPDCKRAMFPPHSTCSTMSR